MNTLTRIKLFLIKKIKCCRYLCKTKEINKTYDIIEAGQKKMILDFDLKDLLNKLSEVHEHY